METNALNLKHSAQFCMICLDVHRKLYPKSTCNLNMKFKNLTGISLEDAINFSPMFCSECAQRLINCNKFRDKSLRAFQLLSELVQNNAVLSLQTLLSVDRVRLTSSLVKKTFEPDHCDLYITENTKSIDKTSVKREKQDLQLEFEDVSVSNIKCEFDFVQNDTSDSSDSVEAIDADLSSNENDALYETNRNIKIKKKVRVLNYEIEKNEIISDLKCLGDYDYDFDDDTIETEILNENDKTDVKGSDKKNDVSDVICLDDDLDIDVDIENDTKDSKQYNIHVKFLNNDITKDHNYYKNENSLNNRILKKRIKSERVNSVSLKEQSTKTVKQYERVYYNKKVRRKSGLDKPKGDVKLKNAVKDRTARVKSKKIRVNKIDSEGNVVGKVLQRKRQPKKEKKLKASIEYEELKEFEVTERSPEEQLADWMLRQQSESYQCARFRCETCFKAFSDMEVYDTHMGRHAEKYGPLSCPVCLIRVKRRGRLTSHVDNNHRYRYTCSNCGYVTTNKGCAIRHTQWHNGIKYKCSHCDKEFDKYTSRLSHMRLKHPSEHVCALCGFSFVSEKGLMFHTSKKHYCDDKQELSGPRCEECGVRFANHAAYETHVNVSPKHTGPGLIQANEPSRKKLRKKENNEDTGRVKEIECEVCGIELDSGRSYRFHLMASHPQHNRTKFSRAVLICDQCGKVCNSKHIFEEHLLIHSGEKPLECGVCGKRFRHSASFKVHVERHSGTAPSYQCEHCAYETKDKGNLTRHTQTHLDPNARKLYNCNECGKTFTTSVAMKNHVDHVHHKVPWPKRVRPSRPCMQAT